MMYSQQYSQSEVLEVSTLTKLVRNTAMVFVIPYMAYQNNSQSKRGSIFLQIKSIFPFFILGFIGFGILRTLGDLGRISIWGCKFVRLGEFDKSCCLPFQILFGSGDVGNRIVYGYEII